MTIAELIEELSKLESQDVRVVIRGYEGGVDDICCIEFMKIALDVNKDKWYYGSHEEIYEDAIFSNVFNGDHDMNNSAGCGVPAYKIG